MGLSSYLITKLAIKPAVDSRKQYKIPNSIILQTSYNWMFYCIALLTHI